MAVVSPMFSLLRVHARLCRFVCFGGLAAHYSRSCVHANVLFRLKFTPSCCLREFRQPDMSSTQSNAGAGSTAGQVSEFTSPSLEEPGPAKSIFADVVFGANAENAEETHDDCQTVVCQECAQDCNPLECQRIGNSAKKSGKQPAIWKCNRCNSLNSRMNRLFAKTSTLAADWQSLSPDEKTDFMKRSQGLHKEELEHGVSTTIRMNKSNRTTLAHQYAGDFLPISVYESRGFTAVHIKAIVANAPKKFSPALNDYVYQAMIESSSSKDEDITTNLVTYETGTDQGPPSKKAKLGASKEELDRKVKLEAEQMKKKDEAAIKLQQKKEAMLKKSEDEKQKRAHGTVAKKIISMLSTLVAQAPQLRSRCIAPGMSGKLPEFILKEFEDYSIKVQAANGVWQDVMLKGEPAPLAASLQLDQVSELKKVADKTFNNLNSMINIVEKSA